MRWEHCFWVALQSRLSDWGNMIIQNRKFLIYGCGKTGISLAVFITKHGGRIAIYDKKNKTLPKEISNLGGENRCDTNKKQLFEGIYAMILSPGISVGDDVVLQAIKGKVPVFSELDFSMNYLKGVKIGITASCGKSTITKMIYEMLSEDYKDVRIGGNYGIPTCELCENSTETSISVIEVSSFMLEQSRTFHFDIAVFANLSKNHLNRHKTMKKYTAAKCKISKNMSAPDIIILPQGDNKIKAKMLDCAKKTSPPQILCFQKFAGDEKVVESNKMPPPNRVENGSFYIENKPLMQVFELAIQGRHNVENFLVAAMVASAVGCCEKSMLKIAREFKALPHRFEKVAEKSGVTYINDSKSTSAKSAETSLEMITYPAVIMIGGSDKADDFLELFKKIKANSNIIKTVLYGAVLQKLEFFSKTAGYFNYEKCSDFKTAFNLANSLCAKSVTLVLMSACPSYDEFENFEQRGEEFARLAKGVN